MSENQNKARLQIILGVSLLLAFALLPLLELGILIQIYERVGLLVLLALVLIPAIVGGALARNTGLATLKQIRTELAMGLIPTDSTIDGVIILAASALLLAPGLITDAVGLCLLFSRPRSYVRKRMKRLLQRRSQKSVSFD